MAEYCLKCFNKHFNKNFSSKDVILAKDFCEGCSEIKPCVMTILPENRFERVLYRIFKNPNI